MKPVIISSKTDEASLNIFENIKKEYVGKNERYEHYRYKDDIIDIYLFNEELVFLEEIDREIEGDFFIFISKHESRNPIKCFTHHSIGNFSNAELGGKTSKLVQSSARANYIAHKLIMEKLKENWEFQEWQYFQEATHHGPYLDKPSIFLEIGSTKEEWKNRNAGELMANVAIELAEKLPESKEKITPSIAIGTLHNAASMNKYYDKGYAISHIMPKYMLHRLKEGYDSEEMSRKTIERVETIILDWKSIGKEKENVVKSLRWFNGIIIKRK